MNDCIFCGIVGGKIPCAKVLETDNVIAFLDIAPVAKGHTLVIPKKHLANILEMDIDLAADLHEAVQKVGRSMLASLKADGFNLGMNNFEAAGQLVMHAHYHIIPRYNGDELKLWPQHSYDNEKEMEIYRSKIALIW